MKNEYLDLLLLNGGEKEGLVLKSGSWPDSKVGIRGLSRMIMERMALCLKYSFAIPDADILEEIKIFSEGKVVEIGAGTGYWARMLHDVGVDIIASDIYRDRNDYYFPISKVNKETVAKMGHRTLMLCWPPYDSNMAFDFLSFYSGDRLVYIGESCGGCTANDKFFDELQLKWKLVNEVDVYSWVGICDACYFYVRR